MPDYRNGRSQEEAIVELERTWPDTQRWALAGMTDNEKMELAHRMIDEGLAIISSVRGQENSRADSDNEPDRTSETGVQTRG